MRKPMIWTVDWAAAARSSLPSAQGEAPQVSSPSVKHDDDAGFCDSQARRRPSPRQSRAASCQRVTVHRGRAMRAGCIRVLA